VGGDSGVTKKKKKKRRRRRKGKALSDLDSRTTKDRQTGFVVVVVVVDVCCCMELGFGWSNKKRLVSKIEFLCYRIQQARFSFFSCFTCGRSSAWNFLIILTKS